MKSLQAVHTLWQHFSGFFGVDLLWIRIFTGTKHLYQKITIMIVIIVIIVIIIIIIVIMIIMIITVIMIIMIILMIMITS